MKPFPLNYETIFIISLRFTENRCIMGTVPLVLKKGGLNHGGK